MRRRTNAAPAADRLRHYLDRIAEVELLTAAEEKELARRIALGDEAAREHMIRANLRLVVRIARAYLRKGLPLEDLVQWGNAGLLVAVERFDPAVGVRFSTYGSYWIKQSISRELSNTARPIRIPIYAVGLMVKWRRKAAELRAGRGCPPAPFEVARALRLGDDKAAVALAAVASSEIRYVGIDADGDDYLAAPDPGPGDAEHAETLRLLRLRLESLDDRSRAVLAMRFGLSGEPPATLRATAKALGITGEWVRRIQNQALDTLARSFRRGDDP